VVEVHESEGRYASLTFLPKSDREKTCGALHFPLFHVRATSCAARPMTTQRVVEGHCRAKTSKKGWVPIPERGMVCGEDHTDPFWVIMKPET
jgi:hypothetical protein